MIQCCSCLCVDLLNNKRYGVTQLQNHHLDRKRQGLVYEEVCRGRKEGVLKRTTNRSCDKHDQFSQQSYDLRLMLKKENSEANCQF